ncbi:hypothetical protein WA026_010999 [Henosepilachna vigintioctopunctata]|uniref:Uncharacterized protein n=1 Tax=Henosepilachna vigintioctopunctata TaxID=420089 RepID=A0AAW1UPM1_9CUCU
MDISRGTLLGCSEKQSIRRLEIYPSSNLFKENVLDKLLELKLLKFTEGTKICLGNIPMNLFFDVELASSNCCGNNIIKEADKLTEEQQSNDNQEVICNFNSHELGNSTFDAPKAINLFPIFCGKTVHSTEFTLSHDGKITYICSNETQCNTQPSNQLELINRDTYSDSMRVGSEFSTRNNKSNMKLQHVNSFSTLSESASRTLIRKSRIYRANIQNRSLMKLDNFVNVSQPVLPNASTLFMQLEYPCSFLVYSLLNQQDRMQKSPKCLIGTDDKLNRKITNVKCKCREKKRPCSHLHQKDKPNTMNKFRSSGVNKTCGCLHLDRIFSSDKTMVRKLSKIHDLRGIRNNICGETFLMKSEFSNEAINMKTSSPMRLDLWSRSNQEKQSLTKSEDTIAENLQRKEGCAKMRKPKRKCGCIRPYETSTALPLSAPPRPAQKKRYSCSCKISDKLAGPLDKPNTRDCLEKLNAKQSKCRINFNNRKDKHLCDVCKLVYGIGDIMDEKESLISIEFSDVDKLISILDDVKNTGSKISTSIKRLKETNRNAEPNDFDEYLLTCSTEGANKPNTIGIKIKYSDYKIQDQKGHVKSDNCSCLGGNLNETNTTKDIECIFQKVCPCATSSRHDAERSNGAECVCATKKIYESAKNEDQASKGCRFPTDRRISQGQVMPLIEVEFQADGDVRNEVECIFKSERICSYSSKSESPSTTNIETRKALKKQDQEVLRKSCYKESCPKLTEPLIFPEKKDCLVEESCIRERLLRTICVIPDLSASENAEPLKSTTQKRGPQKKASNKTEKKGSQKTAKKKADSPKLTPGKPLPKKTNSKKGSSTPPNKVPSKQKNPKEKVSSPSVNKAPAPKKKSKQKTSVSDTTVRAPKAKSKQKTSLSDTKVPERKTNSKQSKSSTDTKAPAQKTNSKKSKSSTDTKVPAQKTNSKKSKSSTDTKVPARKTNSKQTTSVNATKTSSGKTNSKKGSAISATKKPSRKTNSKDKASINTDQKASAKSKPVKVPTKKTKSRRDSSISKKPDTIQFTPELPVLRLNEVDQALLSQALEVFLRKRGFL